MNDRGGEASSGDVDDLKKALSKIVSGKEDTTPIIELYCAAIEEKKRLSQENTIYRRTNEFDKKIYSLFAEYSNTHLIPPPAEKLVGLISDEFKADVTLMEKKEGALGKNALMIRGSTIDFSKRSGKDVIARIKAAGKEVMRSTGITEHKYTQRGMDLVPNPSEKDITATHYMASPIYMGKRIVGSLVANRNSGHRLNDQERWLFEYIAFKTSAYFIYMGQHESTLNLMYKSLAVKSDWTAVHSEGAVGMAIYVASKRKFSQDELDSILWGGSMHDIGKIGIPEDILNKPGKLNNEEYETVKQHPENGYKIIGSTLPGDAGKIVLHHHERYDGEGYPHGIHSSELPRTVNLFAVTDAFQAMIGKRPYRKGKTPQEAMNVLVQDTGSQFDPKSVKLFKKVFDSTGRTKLINLANPSLDSSGPSLYSH